MLTRLTLTTLLLCFLSITWNVWFQGVEPEVRTNIAMNQMENTPESSAVSRVYHKTTPLYAALFFVAGVGGVYVIYRKPLREGFTAIKATFGKERE